MPVPVCLRSYNSLYWGLGYWFTIRTTKCVRLSIMCELEICSRHTIRPKQMTAFITTLIDLHREREKKRQKNEKNLYRMEIFLIFMGTHDVHARCPGHVTRTEPSRSRMKERKIVFFVSNLFFSKTMRSWVAACWMSERVYVQLLRYLRNNGHKVELNIEFAIS